LPEEGFGAMPLRAVPHNASPLDLVVAVATSVMLLIPSILDSAGPVAPYFRSRAYPVKLPDLFGQFDSCTLLDGHIGRVLTV
jgi:hypothetical protein